ncbi:MAG: hypothetical protein JRI33_03815 [Deltaproteobacteria bacterium]|nr:hypothetical protein [Deltaproteobacteria bacterium]
MEKHTELPARLFSERTYPSPNDTALLEHGHLTAALALVVGGNIILKEESKKNQFNYVVKFIRKGEAIKINDLLVENFGWNFYKNLVLKNLDARLVRISFRWYEHLFYEAVRLDDIHGVRNFLDTLQENRLMKLFKESFHQKVGAFFGPHNDVSRALRPLNDFPFDLVYLLPGALGEEVIKTEVRNAYKQAVSTIAPELQQEYARDFNVVKKQLAGIVLNNSELFDQLLGFAPFCCLGEIKIQAETSISPDEALLTAKQSLAQQTLNAYTRLWQAEKISQSEGKAKLDFIRQNSSLDESEFCEVCGLNDVFKEFYQKYEELLRSDINAAKIMEKVIYSHKEEPEKLCRACFGRRLWSHGMVQEDWLEEMLEAEEKNDTVLVQLKTNVAPPPPPKLIPRLEISKASELPEDMGAAFVRWRNNRLQVYPTLAAAADIDGNLALIYLRPNWQHGIVAELHQCRPTVDTLCCIFHILHAWNESYQKIQDAIQNWTDMIRSGKSGQLIGAKNQCLRLLEYLNDWPNNLFWHPLHHLAVLVKKLASANEEKKVKAILSDLIRSWHDFFSAYSRAGDSDLERFEAALVAYVAGLTETDVQNGFRDEALRARPHLARVLTRIRWIDEFFRNSPRILVDKGGIRTLTLEDAYPHLVVAVPATDLIRALRILHYSMTHNLFSSTLYGEEPPFPNPSAYIEATSRRLREELSLELLRQILPPVLLGTVVIFKEKQPLYHVLASARKVIDHLESNFSQYPGFLLGLTDWRRCLGAMTEEQARDVLTINFCELYHILDIENQVSRRALTSLSQTARGDWGSFPELFEAMLAIKQTRQAWPDRVRETLGQKNLFDAMCFLKTAAKS